MPNTELFSNCTTSYGIVPYGAQTRLIAPMGAGDTSLVVESTKGFPAISGAQQFRIQIGHEIIIVGATAGATFSSLTRGAEGTTAVAHPSGAVVAQAVTAGALSALPSLSMFNVQTYGAVGDGVTDDSTAILAAVAAIPASGGVLWFSPGKTYKTTQILALNTSNIILLGNGATLLFQPTDPVGNDRAMHIGSFNNISSNRNITGAIAVGATSLTASAAGSTTDLVPGDWVLIQEVDNGSGTNIVIFDWMQVLSVSGTTINVMHPFRTAFPGTHSTFFFNRVTTLTQNVVVKDLRVKTTSLSGPTLPGIFVGVARNTTIENAVCEIVNGNGFATYRAAGLSIHHCVVNNDSSQATEFAATVDLDLDGNSFGTVNVQANATPLNVDYGTAFFTITNNRLYSGAGAGTQFLWGVHDGVYANNVVGWTRIANGLGLNSLGSQRVQVSHNVFIGGDGSGTGISFADTTGGTTNIVSKDNVIAFNIVKNYTTLYNVSPNDVYMIPAASGYLGVGTPTPGAKFHISGSAAISPQATALRLSDTGNGTNSRDWVIGSGSGTNYGDLAIFVGNAFGSDPVNGAGAEVMTLAKGGNVGIGATGPAALLSVGGNGSSSYTVDITGSAHASTSVTTPVVSVPSGGSTTISTGVGSVKMSSANAATNTSWIPITYAGTVYYVPGFTTNSP